MKFNTEFKDYKIIATGDGMKLEKWGKYVLLRPDPQVIWPSRIDMEGYKGLSAVYKREGGGGAWRFIEPIPDEFNISWRNLTFSLRLTGFKHTGLFPEQAVNWSAAISLIEAAKRPVSVLNLFAYTGGATAACLSAGASVCHVDAARAMVERAQKNVLLSGLKNDGVRYIVDDCIKFVGREIKRGKRYDAVIMDPPSFGRGPNNEMWKIEDGIYSLVDLTRRVMSDRPLFHLINSYTTGLQPGVMNSIQRLVFGGGGSAVFDAYEVGLPTEEDIILPCGASAFINFNGGLS
ncbi:MAG: class I SAM-dependent methyltransferase [Clostridiales bacterium]|jgi:23S rRNA (cytosine1962-C5)-methyltransferase|nr:class I SAM-dependent methyltransferase [Clostridiales bacterium]